jgi:hypothetical protein
MYLYNSTLGTNWMQRSGAHKHDARTFEADAWNIRFVTLLLAALATCYWTCVVRDVNGVLTETEDGCSADPRRQVRGRDHRA